MFLVLASSLFLAMPVSAQQAGGLAIAIILDSSGSMLTNEGGRLFVASDIPGLMEFFRVVASQQEAALYTPPEMHFSFEAKPVTAGDSLPVRAGLKVWGEPLLPSARHLLVV
ncbi:MAG: hypothetical protein Q8P50_18815 [Bacillota bacterium]|nr:hypothetical protein [Bacillota bacterium]